MMTPDKVVFLIRDLHQRDSHQRRLVEVVIRRPIPLEISVEFLLHFGWREHAPVFLVPVECNFAEHYLHRLVNAIADKHRAQDLVTIDHLLPRTLKRLLVELLKDQLELYYVKTRARREEGMEQKSLLQRCQRIDVFQSRMLRLDQFQLLLLDPCEWEVRRRVSTCTFTLTVRDQRLQSLYELRGHALDRFATMHCLAVSEVHLQLPVDDHAADRQQM